jgi:hypothetical protein
VAFGTFDGIWLNGCTKCHGIWHNRCGIWYNVKYISGIWYNLMAFGLTVVQNAMAFGTIDVAFGTI